MSEEETGQAGQEKRSVSGGSALKALISFFTIWHMDIDERDMDAMERNFGVVPLVGVLFAVVMIVELTVLIWLNYTQGFGSGMMWAVILLATAYIGSKFIHFDGLTDFGDGMIVSGKREDHVRALKDTLVGAGGIGVALVVVLLSVSIYGSAGVFLIAFAPLTEILVKNAMVAAATFGNPGNGMASRQVSMTTTRSLGVSIVISVVVGLILAFVTVLIYQNIIVDNSHIRYSIELVDVILCYIIGLVLSVVVGWLMARNANSVFGMVNGDILGATNEIARPVVMFAMILPFICWLG